MNSRSEIPPNSSILGQLLGFSHVEISRQPKLRRHERTALAVIEVIAGGLQYLEDHQKLLRAASMSPDDVDNIPELADVPTYVYDEIRRSVTQAGVALAQRGLSREAGTLLLVLPNLDELRDRCARYRESKARDLRQPEAPEADQSEGDDAFRPLVTGIEEV